jgi:hypothetical protein
VSESTESKPPQVFAAIQHVMADVAKLGVGKNQKNTQQNFIYRGIDDVMDALAPLLPKHSLVILPSVLDHRMTERESRSGGKLFHTLLKLQYKFVSPLDGSTEVVGPFYGEAMDSGDKSTSKAMAIAYKYMCLQAFNIPINPVDDPDASTHEVAAAQNESRAEGLPQHAPAAPSVPRSSAPAALNLGATAPEDVPAGADGKPRVARSGGDFGYGRKFATTPWSVMETRDLKWFLGAERTPTNIRQKIAVELAWRDYETSQLDAARERQRMADEESIGRDEDIPYEPR